MVVVGAVVLDELLAGHGYATTKVWRCDESRTLLLSAIQMLMLYLAAF